MAYYVPSTKKYLVEAQEPDGSVWRKLFHPATECPASGIYRCANCGDEVTCNKGDRLPPQNHSQHTTTEKNIMGTGRQNEDKMKVNKKHATALWCTLLLFHKIEDDTLKTTRTEGTFKPHLKSNKRITFYDLI